MTSIADIYGSYGLTQNATTDPYAQDEAKIKDAVTKQLNDLASTNKEVTSSKGFDTSFFDNGQLAKQEGDVLSNLYSTFAQNRIQNTNAELNMNRNIVQNKAITDTNTAAQSGLMTQQANINSAASTQSFNQQTSLTAQQGDIQKQLAVLDSQLKDAYANNDVVRQKDIMNQQAALNSQLSAQNASQQTGLVLTQGDIQKQLATLDSQLKDAYANNDVNRQKEIMAKQADLNSQLSAQSATQQTNLITTQATLQKQADELNAQLKDAYANNDVTRQKQIISAQADVQKQLANLNTANQKELLATENVLQRQTLADQFGYTTQINAQNASLTEIAAQQNEGRTLTTLQAQIQGQLTVLDKSADNDINKINVQFKNGEISADNALDRQKELLANNTQSQLSIIDKQWKDGQIDAQTAFHNQAAILDKNFSFQMAQIETQFKNGEISADNNQQRQIEMINTNSAAQLDLFKKQAEYKRANLAEDLKPQLDNDMALLQKKMEIEKETALNQVRTTFYTNLIGQGVSFLTNGVLSGLPK